MKKSRKQKSRKIKKSKTRKQKGGDNCEKSNILEKLDESLVKYNNIVYAKKTIMDHIKTLIMKEKKTT
jgi:hypothetical protein